MSKYREEEKAVKLRKKGLSYLEILKEVPVAKSTLSLWLRNVDLSKPQRQRLIEKRLLAARAGALKKKQQRLDLIKKIGEESLVEMGKLDKKVFQVAGAAFTIG